MDATVYVLVGRPDEKDAIAELKAIGFKNHGIVTFTTSMGIEMDVHIMLKEGKPKTKKQVASGYHRPVCTKCNRELHPETNGVGVLDMFRPSDSDKAEPYELYDADKWKCPQCGMEVIGGFGEGCVSAHYKNDFQNMIDSYDIRGLLIKNTG